ncbi:hypothetical protein OOU_Y34scaffold00192g46 [Pyricularia oryzae Y34]|uniref:MSP domain-containing protein n=1 Tax=Pyricularia oryzae (strain Y34) TaxID=1143189 RepID=A0AA97P6C2_PYRO3|nr:hypothetical protein OOU_Y34scaffold00192g46 [Pyricularia oryzae Y34]
MSVELDPSELGFRTPKQYCVRPNSGRIEPDHEVEVQVLLQAMKQDPPADAKCRDKFLVQAVPISGDKEFATVADIVGATPDVPPPSYSSPEQTSAAAQPASSPSVDANKAKVKVEPESPSNISSSISAATAQVAQSKPVEQVKEKVAEVKSAVASTVEDSGLKQRKTSATSAVKRQTTASAPVTKVHPAAQQAPQGVPVHMVAALCLVSFLLAYFFF